MPGNSESHLISREISIDAGHRVMDHLSKCRNLHGHRYTIQAWCRGPLYPAGEQCGMVLDFGFLKEEMMAQIDAPFDHSFIFSVDDELCVDMFGLGGDPEKAAVDCALRESGRYYGQGRGMKISVLPVVPTAENLARFWYEMLAARIVERSDGKASLVCLKVWETPNCWAAYGPLMELGIADG